MSERTIESGLYGAIFNEPCAEIDFMSIISASNSPVIDLRPIRKIYRSNGKSRLPGVVLKPFLELGKKDQAKVIFIGSASDIEAILQCVPGAKDDLLVNPSVTQILKQE